MKQQLGRDAFISVFKDPVYGWNARSLLLPAKPPVCKPFSMRSCACSAAITTWRNRGRLDCNYYDSGKSDILDRFSHESVIRRSDGPTSFI
jgi:hypothetical protein